MKTREKIQDKIAKEYQSTGQIAWKLRAWAALLHALDLVSIELARRPKRPKTPM